MHPALLLGRRSPAPSRIGILRHVLAGTRSPRPGGAYRARTRLGVQEDPQLRRRACARATRAKVHLYLCRGLYVPLTLSRIFSRFPALKCSSFTPANLTRFKKSKLLLGDRSRVAVVRPSPHPVAKAVPIQTMRTRESSYAPPLLATLLTMIRASRPLRTSLALPGAGARCIQMCDHWRVGRGIRRGPRRA